MTTGFIDNVVQFPGTVGPDQEADAHREVIATLTLIIRQMSDLVNAINEGPTTDGDKAKFASCLCSASALCLRAQMEYFEQFIGVSERLSNDPPFEPPLPSGPPT